MTAHRRRSRWASLAAGAAIVALSAFSASQAAAQSIEVRSRDVRPAGFVMSKGPVIDALIPYANKSISAYVWFDENPESGLDEIDGSISVNKRVADGLTISAVAAVWKYPSGRLGNQDVAAKMGATYNGTLDAQAMYRQVISRNPQRSGSLTTLQINKPIALRANEVGLSIDPCMQAAYLDDFFTHNGLGRIDVGADLTTKIDGIGVRFGLHRQYGFNGLPTVTYVSAGVRLQ